MSDCIYTRVTATIIEALERGVRPWAPSWDTPGGLGVLPIRATGEAYRGVNVLLLWGSAAAQGFDQPRWMTFKQAQAAGGCVRKGEKGTKVVYAGRIVREGEADDGADDQVIPFLKGYTVFNVAQVEGLGAEWFVTPPAPRPEPERDAAAEAFFAAVGADVRHHGARAYYDRDADAITLPPLAAFHDAEGYYATRAHETVHWTGHERRLGREFGKRFGDQAYAAEELVAEIGAAFVCAQLGLSAEPREDHSAYLAGWLKCLKADKRAIFTAASAAQAACDYLRDRATPAALAA
jgi:antirestriction protein ArdC